MAVGPQTSVLAPRFSRFVCIVVFIVCIVTAVSLVQYGHLEVTLRAFPAVLFAAAGSYVVFWQPHVVLTPQSLIAVNPFRTLVAPWSAVKAMTAHWTLTVSTTAGAFAVWSAPAQSPWSAVGTLRRDALGRPSLAGAGTPTTAIAPLVNQQWSAHREGPEAAGEATIRWNLVSVVVVAVLGALTLVGILWP